jgi:hypothetical protein
VVALVAAAAVALVVVVVVVVVIAVLVHLGDIKTSQNYADVLFVLFEMKNTRGLLDMKAVQVPFQQTSLYQNTFTRY